MTGPQIAFALGIAFVVCAVIGREIVTYRQYKRARPYRGRAPKTLTIRRRFGKRNRA